MEKHAVPSNGEYYVWRTGTIEFKGPFFPQTREERLSIFVRETINESTNWQGAYFRRLPEEVRKAVRREESK